MNKYFFIVLYFIFLFSYGDNLCKALNLEGEDMSKKYGVDSCGVYNSRMQITFIERSKERKTGGRYRFGFYTNIRCPDGYHASKLTGDYAKYGNECILDFNMFNLKVEFRGYFGGIYIYMLCPNGFKLTNDFTQCRMPLNLKNPNDYVGNFYYGNSLYVVVKDRNNCPQHSNPDSPTPFSDGFHCQFDNIDITKQRVLKVSSSEILIAINNTCMSGYKCFYGFDKYFNGVNGKPENAVNIKELY